MRVGGDRKSMNVINFIESGHGVYRLNHRWYSTDCFQSRSPRYIISAMMESMEVILDVTKPSVRYISNKKHSVYKDVINVINPTLIFIAHSGLTRVRWDLTFWAVLRVGEWHHSLQTWWGLKGQWRFKNFSYTVIAVSLKMGRNWWSFAGSVTCGFIKVASPSPIMCSAVDTKRTGYVATVPFSFCCCCQPLIDCY